MDSSVEKKISDVSVQAKDFIGRFYNHLDASRVRLDALYSANPTLVWNGNKIQGAAGMIQFLKAMPQSKHTIDAMEAQPTAAVPGVTVLLLTTKGSVEYGSDSPRPFSHSFVLLPDAKPTAKGQQQWVIQNECFRLH
eukprot:m.210070 g.210070  ORF g.210070 m.210070 type:complete len:137 (+) comp18998_c2_seq1:239-649(+)